jgi:hypothetical protein
LAGVEVSWSFGAMLYEADFFPGLVITENGCPPSFPLAVSLAFGVVLIVVASFVIGVCIQKQRRKHKKSLSEESVQLL